MKIRLHKNITSENIVRERCNCNGFHNVGSCGNNRANAVLNAHVSGTDITIRTYLDDENFMQNEIDTCLLTAV